MFGIEGPLEIRAPLLGQLMAKKTSSPLPQVSELVRACIRFFTSRSYRQGLWRNRMADPEVGTVFREICRTNHWASSESVSGPGSTLVATEVLRSRLPALLQQLDVQTLLDLPCGDFHWMRHVPMPSIRYIGGDVVPELIDRLQQTAAAPHRSFQLLDLTTDELPAADLILCRDCLVHLSTARVLASLRNVCRIAGARYLLTTHFPDVTDNDEIRTGEWRPLNLVRPPFALPEPELLIDERPDGLDPRLGRKCSALWRLDAVRDALATAPR